MTGRVDPADTTTRVSVAATASWGENVEIPPTRTSNPSTVRGVKFGASKRSVYMPGARWLKTNPPLSVTTASWTTPRLSSRAVTVASWITAGVSS